MGNKYAIDSAEMIKLAEALGIKPEQTKRIIIEIHGNGYIRVMTEGYMPEAGWDSLLRAVVDAQVEEDKEKNNANDKE